MKPSGVFGPLLSCTLLGSLGLIGLLSGCQSESWVRLSPSQVRSTIIDLSMLSAALQRRAIPDSIRMVEYEDFFVSRGMTQVDWDSSMAWYAKNDLRLYYDFYRVASDSLKRWQTALEHKQDSLRQVEEIRSKRRRGDLDSVNLLSNRPVYAYCDGSLLNHYVDFVPLSPYDSIYSIELSTRLLALPRLKKPLRLGMRLHLGDSTSRDSSILVSGTGVYSLRLDIPDGKQVKRITGYLRGYLPNLPDKRMIVVDSISLARFPRIGATISHDESVDNDFVDDEL